MALVDPVAPASPNEHILGVVRHADHFVWNNLPERQNQIVTTFDQQLVDLRRPRLIVDSLR